MSDRLLIIDSREKPHAIKGIVSYLDKAGIQHETSKLLFGDYMDYNHPGLVIDRKQNISELAKNCTVEHERFRRELERAQKAGATLVILVEQDKFFDRGECIRVSAPIDLICWSSPHTQIRGEKVYRVLVSWLAKYPLRIEFCDRRSTGKRIVDILYREAQNA